MSSSGTRLTSSLKVSAARLNVLPDPMVECCHRDPLADPLLVLVFGRDRDSLVRVADDDDPAVLRRALDQRTGLLDDVRREALDDRTPCAA
jgi:hypothetical protein